MITDCVFNVLLLTVTNLNNLPDTATDKVRIAAIILSINHFLQGNILLTLFTLTASIGLYAMNMYSKDGTPYGLYNGRPVSRSFQT